jgi:hypothetical protein
LFQSDRAQIERFYESPCDFRDAFFGIHDAVILGLRDGIANIFATVFNCFGRDTSAGVGVLVPVPFGRAKTH